jgi:hypothetical protein
MPGEAVLSGSTLNSQLSTLNFPNNTASLEQAITLIVS